MSTPSQFPPPPLGWFAHLRAILVILHLIAITWLALPSPGEGLSRWAWQDPTVQEELADWTGRLNRWGYPITQAEFEDDLYNVASAYESVRSRPIGLFGRYYGMCGTFQSWRMFAGPHRYPSQLLIDVEEDSAWRPVYVQRDPEHAWLSTQLDHYRMRPFLYRLSWYRYVAEFDDFGQLARWIARQAAHDFPQAGRIRVRFFKFHTPAPAEARAGLPVTGEFVPEMVLNLEAAR